MREEGIVVIVDSSGIKVMGEGEWAKEKGYGRRDKVEGIFSRLKGIFGDRVRARSWEGRKSEIGVRIWILNRMLEMGDGMSCMVGS